MNKTQLVIGSRGEVGSALQNILKCEGIDVDFAISHSPCPLGCFDVLHICFPYSKEFVREVKGYIYQFKSKLIIIHSTVPIGATRRIGENAVHSPVRGMHPELSIGIRIFTKFFGGKKAEEAAEIFRELGISVRTCEDPRNTEAGKLWSTTAYGLSIILEKEIKKYCDGYNIDFNIVYKEFTETYNQGYTELGMPNVARPVLKHMEGEIGGHCIIANCKLLKTKISKFILNLNLWENTK